MGLKDVGASLPPGFRFYPNDEELVLHYLYKKITNEDVLKGTLVEIDLHTCEPWQLPEVAKLNATEWYFFSFRDRKYATGYRTNRATISGYWKATGKDRTVFDPITGEIVGMRKTLVFYMNRAPNGIKTGWIMHEFRLETPHMPPKEDWVLCRVFHKGNEDNNNTTKLIIPQQQQQQQSIMYIEKHENTISPPSLTLANSSSPTMPIGYNQFSSPMPIHNYHQQNNNNNNNNYLMDLFEFSRETTNTNNSSSVTQISPKGEDDGYGFLWDMDLEENTSFHDGVGVASSNLDGIRFQFDNNDDNNSMVFL